MMLFPVHLTTLARESYVALCDQAQEYLDNNEDENLAVTTFEEVHTAMTETLSSTPYTSGWAMAGDLSWLRVLNLNSVTIIYVIAETEPEPKVIVQTITGRKKDTQMRLWLSKRIYTDEWKPILETLGIQLRPELARIELDSVRVH